MTTTMPDGDDAPNTIGRGAVLLDAMRVALKQAMRERDRAAVTALRTALAAVANAEAPPIDSAPMDTYGAAVEHPRLELGDDQIVAIVRHQIEDRRATLEEIAGFGRDAEADELAREVEVLEQQLLALDDVDPDG